MVNGSMIGFPSPRMLTHSVVPVETVRTYTSSAPLSSPAASETVVRNAMLSPLPEMARSVLSVGSWAPCGPTLTRMVVPVWLS